MSHPLPPELRAQLDAFRRRLFVQESLWAAGTVLGGLLAAALVLFVLDRFVETPHWARLLLLLCGLAAAAFGAGRWIALWVLHPRDDRRLSLLVQRKYRRLGDSLLSAIELAEGRITDDTISPELRDAAVASVAKQAGALDFVRAVDWRATARIAAGAAAGLALAAALGVACMPALRETLLRFVNPFTQAARYTFTKFKPMADVVVARGEPFSVPCELDDSSQWKPGLVHFQVGAGRPGQTAPGRIALPGQTEEVALKVWAGDARESVVIRPEARPALAGVKARMELPAYLRLPAVEAPCGSSLTAVEGARVALSGRATRPLARIEAQSQAAKPAGAAEAPAPVVLAPSLAGADFTLAPVEARGETQVTFSYADTLGLSGAAPHAVTLKARPDQAPEARCTDLAQVVAMLPDQTLSMGVEGADDFGVKAMSMHVRQASAKELQKDQGKEPAVWTERTLPVAQGAPDKVKAASPFTFSPRLLGIPEDTIVELRAGASDYFPGRAESLSQPCLVKVMTLADHAKAVQDMMTEASGKMEDLANTEQDLRAQIEDLAKEMAKDPAKAASPENMKKLAELKAAEQKNAAEMGKLDEKIQKIAKEALQNKDIPKDTMGELAKMSQDMKDAAESSKKASEAMSKAQSAASPEDKKKELEEAAKEEKEAEDKLRKTSKKMDDLQKKLDARNFANRLKREAELQDGRTAESNKLQPTLIGATPETMTPEEKASLQVLVDGQKKSAAAARAIFADLTGSYARSHHEPYHAITEDMEKKELDPRNEALVKKFSGNQLAEASNKGKELATLYRAWAEMLKDKEEGGGGGGGGKSQSLPAELLAAFMQMIESEQDLREETRGAGDLAQARRDALDGKVAEKAVDAAGADKEEAAIAKETAETAGLLAAAQEDQLRFLAQTYQKWANPPENERAVDLVDPELAGDYGTFVDGKRPLPQKVLKLMDATGKAMDDAAKQLKAGHPDATAIAAENEAVELLASIFDQQGGGGKGKGGKPSPAQQMAQQMSKGRGKGKGSGQQPGMGNTGNGVANKEKGGGTHTDPSMHREIGKAGGDAGGFVPPEFQSDIDAFQAEADKMGDKP